MRADHGSRSGDIGTSSAVRPSTSTHQPARPADVAPRFDDSRGQRRRSARLRQPADSLSGPTTSDRVLTSRARDPSWAERRSSLPLLSLTKKTASRARGNFCCRRRRRGSGSIRSGGTRRWRRSSGLHKCSSVLSLGRWRSAAAQPSAFRDEKVLSVASLLYLIPKFSILSIGNFFPASKDVVASHRYEPLTTP